MHAVIVTWDLAGSAQTVASLRDFLRDEAVDRFAQVRGLRLKFWIADEEAQRWGAVLLWESEDAANQPLPTRAAELIGYPPTHKEAFAVEAVTAGLPGAEGLAGYVKKSFPAA